MALWSTPTGIEAFNLYCTQEWMTTERFVQQMTGKFEGNRITEVGHAIHSILEYRELLPDSEHNLVHEDILFDRESVNETLSHIPATGHAEIKGRLTVNTPYGPITLYGRTDNIFGLTVTDFKTMRSQTDAITLMQSYQWRIYLQMFKAFQFNYELIMYHDPEQLESERGRNLPVTMQYDSKLKLFTYPTIQRDIERKCTDFIKTMHDLKIEHVIGG